MDVIPVAACYHCGEPLPDFPVRLHWDGAERAFCCQGCAAAAEWIRHSDLGDYYQLRSAAAMRVGTEPQDLSIWDRDELLDEHSHRIEGGREIIVEVGLLRNHVSLCLDCCGAGLSRRGYRTYNVAAPLSETLGAAIVQLSRFRSDSTLIDPMCGSGTMPSEAAMIAQNIAPGLGRSFAAESWWFFDQGIWTRERQNALDARTNQKIDVRGFDIDERSIDLCKKHAKKAGVFCDWRVQDIKNFNVEDKSGIIVCNPPYGERMMDKDEAKRLYLIMRRVFAPYPGWSVNVFTGMREFEQVYGARADKRRKLTNGGMPCTLYQYFGKRDI